MESFHKYFLRNKLLLYICRAIQDGSLKYCCEGYKDNLYRFYIVLYIAPISRGRGESTIYGEVLEWLKRHAWKACIPQKGIAGSNPALSA